MPSECYLGRDPSDFYAWTPPTGDLSIHLGLAVVRRLEEHCRSLAAQPSLQQAAGVLLGYSVNAPQAATFIEDFVLLQERDNESPCFRGELLIQSLGALARRTALQQKPVGFFRWQRGGWLTLSEADAQAADRFFSDPHDVILLIRHADWRGQQGAFFWREGGRLAIRDASYEFPLHADRLREHHCLPRIPLLNPPANQTPQPVRWIPLARTAAVAMILTAAGLVALGDSHTATPTPALPQRVIDGDLHEHSLGLRVAAQRGQLVIEWNHDASTILDAEAAELQITDKRENRVTQLTGTQLRDGYVAYQPSTADVSVRLEVRTLEGATRAESVRFIGP
ncbi:MAG TPA: hypothetical protein VKX49_11025 [Bryobacteraceae bacterium]|nr:hypothetical protein [Bryobacteraceae bacterium]